MVGGGKGRPVWGPLEVRVAPLRRTLGRVLWILVPSSLWLLQPHDRLGTYSAMFFGAVYALLMVAAIANHLKLRAMDCIVRFDDSGITPRGERTVTWAELASVRQSKKYQGAVVFVPRIGGPPLPLAPAAFGLTRPDKRRERLTRRFGAALVVFTGHLDATADDVAAAVERFGGGVPFVREQV